MEFRTSDQEDQSSGLPMAPMIDVIFLLLIFFVSTSVFHKLEAELNVSIPIAEEAEIKMRTPYKIIINVEKNGVIVLNQKRYNSASLTEQLKKMAAVSSMDTVIIRGDAEAPHQYIINVLNACKAAGIWNIAFAALDEPEELPGG